MSEDVIISRVENGLGCLTLNRPKALHSLNKDMCNLMVEALESWRDDGRVKAIWIDHMPETRGFCAGGDIRLLQESGQSDGVEGCAFFHLEYQLNHLLHSYEELYAKPVIAVIDGVTMGGGVGLSVHGTHRVATERTLFAMPETGIGLFPDVGGGWFLPRLRGELGTWLALTGARLKGADVAAARVATHFLPSELIPNLKAQIAQADFSAGAAEMLGEILSRLSHTVPTGSFEPYMDLIGRCFAHDRAEDIVAALDADGTEWALEQAKTIRSKSPETVKVALRQVREGGQCQTFEENMRMEYRIGWRKVQSPDFIEGVRAVIIDKDHNPSWAPATLEGVTAEAVDQYFAPLGDDDLDFG